MNAAQAAFAALVACFIAAATVLLVLDEAVAGWVAMSVAIFGFLLLVGMIATDRRPAQG